MLSATLFCNIQAPKVKSQQKVFSTMSAAMPNVASNKKRLENTVSFFFQESISDGLRRWLIWSTSWACCSFCQLYCHPLPTKVGNYMQISIRSLCYARQPILYGTNDLVCLVMVKSSFAIILTFSFFQSRWYLVIIRASSFCPSILRTRSLLNLRLT